MRDVWGRIRYIGELFRAPIVEVAHAAADAGRWTLEKGKAIVAKAKDIVPVTVVRKDEIAFRATWQGDTEGGTD